ncbi:hypothetical protein [Micromonospora sp. L32]|uniref:hypothetical protein n=1 Tax=unclassified Micromonospora TaxID=2617518 RepID=UPI003F888952
MNDGYALTVTWASDHATDATVCGECGVIAVRRDSQVWEHPAALRERFSRDVCAQPCSGRPPKPRELTSSQEVVDLIDKWRAGSEEMPPGYTLERDSGFQPKMLMLAQQFAADPDWLQVRQASGNRLQLAARALAQTARLYAIKEIGKDAAYEAAEGHARWALEGRGHSEG